MGLLTLRGAPTFSVHRFTIKPNCHWQAMQPFLTRGTQECLVSELSAQLSQSLGMRAIDLTRNSTPMSASQLKYDKQRTIHGGVIHTRCSKNGGNFQNKYRQMPLNSWFLTCFQIPAIHQVLPQKLSCQLGRSSRWISSFRSVTWLYIKSRVVCFQL